MTILNKIFRFLNLYGKATNKAIHHTAEELENQEIITLEVEYNHKEPESELLSPVPIIPKLELDNIKDAILTDHFNKKSDLNYIPGYIAFHFGQNWRERLNDLFVNGYLRKASPYEVLPFLTVSELKTILKTFGQKVSGKKQDLIDRIISNTSEDLIVLPSQKEIYLSTDRGDKLTHDYQCFILNFPQGRFTYSEIYAAIDDMKKEALDIQPYNVFKYILISKLSTEFAMNNWSNIQSLLLQLAENAQQIEDDKTAITNYLQSIFIELSGLKNDNYVTKYSYISPTPYILQIIDKLIFKLEISEFEFKSISKDAFEKISAKMPFKYFNVDVATDILLDLISTPDTPLSMYINKANMPDKNASNYTYFG